MKSRGKIASFCPCCNIYGQYIKGARNYLHRFDRRAGKKECLEQEKEHYFYSLDEKKKNQEEQTQLEEQFLEDCLETELYSKALMELDCSSFSN
jgi:hypothetical protein